MDWEVVQAKPVTSNTLEVVFRDGVKGIVHFQPSFFHGVFSPLKDANFFKQVRVEAGAVTWPGELDLAPDAMHRMIKQNGEHYLS